MAQELDLHSRICICPIVREPNGLALSSRNKYLSKEESKQATALSRGLEIAEQLVRNGERSGARIAARIRHELTESGITRIDYVAIVDQIR